MAGISGSQKQKSAVEAALFSSTTDARARCGGYPGAKRVRGVITWPFLSLLPVDPDVW
jgi:hypothetical protein